jgi:hypothetical protein
VKNHLLPLFLGASFLLSALKVSAEETPPAEVTIQAAPRKRDPGRSNVRADEARRVPGTRDDSLRVVESLPGVARNAFFGAGGLVLWGAAPGDSKTLVDGVEVPALYHEGGLRGILPSSLVQSVDLAPGAYGPEYGRALGGLVRITTKDLPRDGFHASLGADFLDAAGMISADWRRSARELFGSTRGTRGSASGARYIADSSLSGHAVESIPFVT